MIVRVQKEDFDVESLLLEVRGERKNVGAVCSFVGLVRGESEEGEIEKLELEHHEEMSVKALERLSERMCERYALEDCVLIHRYGELEAGSKIVLVMALSVHRREALEAVSYGMEEMKTEIPFWKCEHYKDGKKRWLKA